jgi:hypothetical protein
MEASASTNSTPWSRPRSSGNGLERSRSRSTQAGQYDIIGSWIPPRLDPWANSFVKVMTSDDPAEAEHWRAELAAGRFPIDIDNER